MRIKFLCGRAVSGLMVVASFSFASPAISADNSYVSKHDMDTCKAVLDDSYSGHQRKWYFLGYHHREIVNFTKESKDVNGSDHTANWQRMVYLKKVYKQCDSMEKKIDKFFRIAIIDNIKRCEKKGRPCTLWHERHQELYDYAIRNNEKKFAATIRKTLQEAAEEAAKENAELKVYEINTNDKVNNGIENAEAYVTIDLNNTLKKMNFDDAVMNKLSVIKNLKIKKLIDQTKMKTINAQGITRTIYCKPKCTLGSPMLQSNNTGIDIGIPLIIYDGISEAINNTLGSISPLKRNDIINLGIGCYKEVATTINDPNINKALAMPIEQLKQIKTLQRQVQASRKKRSERSSGSAEGHDHDHDHEEEDWRTVPGSIYYD